MFLISWPTKEKDIYRSLLQALGKDDWEVRLNKVSEVWERKSEVRWAAKQDSRSARELQTEALSGASGQRCAKAQLLITDVWFKC